jgi:hypothetical protein
MSQVDLPKKQKSGLIESTQILKDIKGIGIVHLKGEDGMLGSAPVPAIQFRTEIGLLCSLRCVILQNFKGRGSTRCSMHGNHAQYQVFRLFSSYPLVILHTGLCSVRGSSPKSQGRPREHGDGSQQ